MPLPLPHHVTVQEQARLLDISPTQAKRLILECNIKIVRRGNGQMEIREHSALDLLRAYLKFDWDMTLKTLQLPPRAFPLPVKPYHSEKFSKLLARIWRRRHAKILTTFTTSSKKRRRRRTSLSTSWRRGRPSKNNASLSNLPSDGL